MDNQHKLIKGYRDLTKEEIDIINTLKRREAEMLEDLGDLERSVPDINKRSLALARTKLQESFMWAIRSVARPNGE